MNLTIHRGTHEIGGTCVEITTDETRIVIDLGMPPADPGEKKKRLKDFSLTGKSVPDLVREGILPRVPGLYWGVGEEKPVDAVLLSHPHHDHYGLFKYILEEIRIYLGEDTDRMLRVPEALLGDKFGRHEDRVLLRDRTPVTIGDIQITPFMTDPPAYGVMAFLVEAEGKRLFYAGDLRGHGRAKVLFEGRAGDPAPGVDAFLIEAPVTGRPGEGATTEDAFAIEIEHEARAHDGMKLFICSGQDVDRLVTFYKAAQRTGAIFVIDLYAANLLQELGRESLPLPSNGFKDVRVLFTQQLMKGLSGRNLKSWSERWRPYEISPEALRRAGKKAFVMYRDSSVHELEAAGVPKDSVLFYSLWSQFTLEPFFEKTQGFLERHGIAFKEMQTSGHAALPDLKRFVQSLDPERIIPIHTEYPDMYRGHFGHKVRCLKAGETLEV